MSRSRARYNKTCNTCGADLICPNCGVPSSTGTPFSAWLRNTNFQVSIHDIDYVWHNYAENWFMTLEEKTHGAPQSQSQKETQGIIFQMLRSASPRLCLTRNGWNIITYRGHHLIVFENTNPDDGAIYLDNIEITKEELLEFLRTGAHHGTENKKQSTE